MHVVPQQTSSVQTPLLQSELALHDFPEGNLVPHWLLVLRQVSPATQSASAAQVVKQEGLLLLHR